MLRLWVSTFSLHLYMKKAIGKSAALCSAFFALALVSILRHELWRDEVQPWLIARDSGSIVELLHNARYEWHPNLWQLLLYGVTRLTVDPFGMQLLHLVIATTTVYIFVRYSPFTMFQKGLFIFGYFPLYEYATISRNYAPGILLIFCFCAAMCAEPRRRYLLLAALLSLLAQTNVFGLMIAMTMALALFFEAVITQGPRNFSRAKKVEIIAAVLLLVVAVTLSYLQLLPPKDSGVNVPWHFGLDLKTIAKSVNIAGRSFVPIPELSHQFWNNNVLGSGRLMFALSLIVLATSSLLLARTPVALFAYCCGTAAIIIFTYVKYYGYLRHHGHIFILFIACLWVAEYQPKQHLSRRSLDALTRVLSKHRSQILIAVLLLQLAAAAIACGMDWVYPFSQAKTLSAFLRVNGMADMFIVANNEPGVSTLAAYLNRKVYYAREERIGSFMVWDKRHWDWDSRTLLEVAKEKAAERQEDILLISSSPQSIGDGSTIQVGEFTGSIVPGEDYYIYLIKYP
jgi:hypothetical protein